MTIQTNLYETFVRPISVLYAAKCWTVRKVDEQRIFTTEMGWLRKLAGISKRRKKKNEDIRTELNQTETLVQKTERGRLQWFGHVKRIRTIPDYRQKHCKPTGTRTRGRPKKRWIVNIRGLTEKRQQHSSGSGMCERQEARSAMQPHRRQLTTAEDGRARRRKEESDRQ